MKQKQLLRTLLAALYLLVGTNAWADATWETYKEWDFEANFTETDVTNLLPEGAWTKSGSGTSASAKVTTTIASATAVTTDTDSKYHGILLRADKDKMTLSSGGITLGGGNAWVTIPNLEAGQRVTVVIDHSDGVVQEGGTAVMESFTTTQIGTSSRYQTVGIVTTGGDLTIKRNGGNTFRIKSILVESPSNKKTATVKMTYVNYNDKDTSYGEIAVGNTAETGYNKIENNTVGFENTGWGVNYITYLQVDASSIPTKSIITKATLTFQGSGSGGSDKNRASVFGAGYNNSEWSSSMTYNTADRSITTIGETYTTTSKKYTTFETVTLDITDALKDDADRIATVIVYETAADHSYIKNPAVTITYVPAYNVTFSETNELNPTITIDDTDVTAGALLPDGTYSFTAKCAGYNDYVGELTVDGADVNKEFTMERTVYSYTVNAVNSSSEVLKTIATGTCYAGDIVNVNYPSHINVGGTLYTTTALSDNNKQYKVTFTPNQDNYIKTITYTATETTDVIYFTEGENVSGGAMVTNGGNSTRCSGGATAYLNNKKLITLPKGTYTATVYCYNSSTKDRTVTITDGQNTLYNQSHGNGRTINNQEFTLTETKTLYITGGHSSQGVADDGIDLVYITGTPTNEIIGALDNSTGYLDDTKDLTIAQGKKMVLTFNNHGGSSNWFNWILRAYQDEGIDYRMRADNYAADGNNDDASAWGDDKLKWGILVNGSAPDWETIWNDFPTQMADANVEMVITYTNAGKLSMCATSTGSSKTYTHKFVCNNTLSGDVKLQLGVWNSWIEYVSDATTDIETIPVAISSVGAATFVSNYALDFSNVEGLDAYIATEQNGANVTFEEVGAVPAGTPLYLRGATADVPVVASADAVGTNLLVAGTGEGVASVVDGKYNFILNYVDNVLGFYRAAGQTVATNRAYLSLTTNPFATGEAKSVNMIFNNDVTGINSVDAQAKEASVKGIYNLQGQRVSNPTKGLYIIDGKKVVIK